MYAQIKLYTEQMQQQNTQNQKFGARLYALRRDIVMNVVRSVTTLKHS